MVFSEAIGQDNWINNQIETALKTSNVELNFLKDLVLEDQKIKMGGEEIKKEQVVNILDKNKNGSRHDIYETGKGAGVTFAVQYALNDMGYDAGTIDGVLGAKTKAAVKEFQKEWNAKNPLLKIAEDGLAGGVTLGRMSWAVMHPEWKTIINSEGPDTETETETETEIKEEDMINIIDQNKNKSRHDIYETGKGIEVTLAVQYALKKMGYEPGTTNSIVDIQTKAAVKEFQKEWNAKNPLLKIAEDGLAGGVTLGRMSWAVMHPEWKTIVNPQTPQNSDEDDAYNR